MRGQGISFAPLFLYVARIDLVSGFRLDGGRVLPAIDF
jgi:hypothetical protein